MKKIEIRYFEVDRTGRSPLGREELFDVDEAVLPSTSSARVFIVKRFSGISHLRWELLHVALQSNFPAIFEVDLFRQTPICHEEYLSETLAKRGGKAASYIHRGSLVEIEYGHLPSIGLVDGTRNSNRRYPDTRQSGEMHKRRLVVVVSVSDRNMQVVPVTSQLGDPADKTRFELSSSTLAKFSFYGSSGKRSFVLCSMIETISFNRVLPPETISINSSGNRTVRRATGYGFALSRPERAELEDALVHGVGVIDYQKTKSEVATLRVQVRSVAGLQARIALLEARCERLSGLEEVAPELARRLGVKLEEEVSSHFEFKALLESEKS